MVNTSEDPVNADLVARLRDAGIDPASRLEPAATCAALRDLDPEAATLDDRLAVEAAALGVASGDLPPDARRRAMEDFYSHRWSGFEIVGDADRNDSIVVVAYDPVWPQVYERRSAQISAALDDGSIRIEHVGSTAVPGLAAKPVIDIQVSVTSLEDERSYVPALEEIGLGLRSRDSHHRYFRPPPPLVRDAHVHVCLAGGTWEADHLLFRDFLLAHDDVRDRYGELKMDLAQKFAADRIAYTEAKSDFIRETMARARTWRSAGDDGGG